MILGDALPINVGQFITDPPIALLIIILLGGILAFYKGWVVPRFVYDRETARADKATEASANVTEALRDLTVEIRQRKGNE